MIKKEKSVKGRLMSAAAAVTLVLCQAGVLRAETADVSAEGAAIRQRVETITKTRQILPETGMRVVNFLDFDLNGDGTLSTQEVGEMLFKLFDGDGNGVIDNVEFEKRNVMTVIPMEKETIVKYDFNNDGSPDKVERSHETFMEKTQLSRFDTAGEGLSPRDFVGKSFRQMDIDGSRFIEMNEWRGAYDEAVEKRNRRQVFYNR
jgi:Ca2+-binding EF-hand superfamily protein